MTTKHEPKRTHADLLTAAAQSWAEHRAMLDTKATNMEVAREQENERAAIVASIRNGSSVIESRT